MYCFIPTAHKNHIIASQHKKISYYQMTGTRWEIARRLMSNWLVSTSSNLSTNKICWLKMLGCQYNTMKKTMASHFTSWSFINVRRDPFCLWKPVISIRSIDFTILCKAGDWAVTSMEIVLTVWREINVNFVCTAICTSVSRGSWILNLLNLVVNIRPTCFNNQ
jgi:hypothetical protein